MASAEWIPTDSRPIVEGRGEEGRSEKDKAAQIASFSSSIRNFRRRRLCFAALPACLAFANVAVTQTPTLHDVSPVAETLQVPKASSQSLSPSAIVEPAAPVPTQLLPGHEALTPQAVWASHAANIPAYLPNAQYSLHAEALLLSDVVASVYRAFPLIEQARLQATVVAGQQLGAWGAYDTKLEGYSLNQPLGFYETYRHGLGAARQTWWGGYIGAGYRIGRGNFEPWYKERETNEGGEYKLAWQQPLLQGRALDPQRVEVFQSNLRRQAVTPEIQASLLQASLDAADAYWYWAASGAILQAQYKLLALAEVRGRQLDALLKANQGKQIDVVVNDQLIAERRGKVVEYEQKLWQAAAKLSLYLRDESGQTLVPPTTWLPTEFSPIVALPEASLEDDTAGAFSRRPELSLLDYEIRIQRWNLQLASNQLLPNVDFAIQGSQDTGAPASSSRDKSQFELEAGIVGNVPIQRRKARGKIQETNGKLAQLEQKRRFQQDKIVVELQSAQTALYTAAESIKQAREALNAAQESLRRYRIAFEQQQVDLIFLNLVEPKVTENEIKLIEQEQRWYSALAAKQAALGLDPLEQSLTIEAARAGQR
jgi:outer membrane protein TolC